MTTEPSPDAEALQTIADTLAGMFERELAYYTRWRDAHGEHSELVKVTTSRLRAHALALGAVHTATAGRHGTPISDLMQRVRAVSAVPK